MSKILVSLIFLITLLVSPVTAEAKLCSQTNWTVQVNSAGQPPNKVGLNTPYTVNITIPSSDYASYFQRFRIRIWSRIPIQGPGHSDEDPFSGLGFYEETVTAPTKNTSGPTTVTVNFTKPEHLLRNTGKYIVEVDYYPKTPSDNSWARKCDTNRDSEKFEAVIATPARCNISELNRCIDEKGSFAPKINIEESAYGYYYFLSTTPPPSVGNLIGIESVNLGTDPYIKYKPIRVSMSFSDLIFSNKVSGSPMTLNQYQERINSLPIDSSKPYYLFVAGGDADANNPLNVFANYQICAIQTFYKTADTSVPLCSSNGPPGPGPGSGGCSGSDCSSASGKECDPSTGNEGKGGVLTAIGCVPTDPKAFIGGVMRFAAGAGGGIALLLMIMGAFQMIASAGNPETIKKGREQFTAAALGLLFILFSALILKILGVDILNIPGFS